MEVVIGVIVAAARGMGIGTEAAFADERISSSSFASLPVKEIYVEIIAVTVNAIGPLVECIKRFQFIIDLLTL